MSNKKSSQRSVRLDSDLCEVLSDLTTGHKDSYSKVIWRLIHNHAEKKYRKKVPARYVPLL